MELNDISNFLFPYPSTNSLVMPTPNTNSTVRSRNTEKRRERSKVAARCRRGKESEIFTELSNCLPVSDTSRSTLDKASVMRLTLCDLKIKEMIENVQGFNKLALEMDPTSEESMFDALINNAVSGFVVVCSCDGDVVYVSEGISTCLGLSQYEVMGQSLLEFSHPCDHGDVKEMLLSSNAKSEVESRSALFRMKSANSTRGRNVHHRTTNYKVVSCFGRIFSADLKVFVGGEGEEPKEEVQTKKWFVGMCEPLLHPSDVDIPLNKQTFLSKHSPDMKFEYVDDSISEFLGYKIDDLIGKSLFDFYHACDGEGMSRSFKSLYTKGQTITERTRFLAKGGGWMWVVTQATSINNSAGKPTSIVCIHFVTSGVECDNEIVSHVQIRDPNEVIIPAKKADPIPVARPCSMEKRPLHESTNLENIKNCFSHIPVSEMIVEPALVNPFTGSAHSKPTPSTAKIFAPRTDDMDTGFLMPVNDTLIVTKEEPADLTHLAPIAGDECVPLSIPLLDDLLQWLDDSDMEYAVVDGYDEPLPLPMITAATGVSIDSPIPVPLASPEMSVLVKEDAMLENISNNSQHCDSPILLRSTDPTLLSSSDPLLLSPFKAPSPEPPFTSAPASSPSCADIMSPDIFPSHYYSDHQGGRGGVGGTAGASSHKSKAGGGYDDDNFSGFPMVSDFQEQLLSPGNYLDGGAPPLSPEITVNLMDRSSGGGGGLAILKAEKGTNCTSHIPAPTMPNIRYDIMNKHRTNTSIGQLKCLSREGLDPIDTDKQRPPPTGYVEDGPLPCKIAKSTYTDELGNNKAWLQIPMVTPPQPPWVVNNGQQLPPASLLSCLVDDESKKAPNLITIGTQTPSPSMINANTRQHQLMQQRQRQLEKYKHILANPAVIQMLLNRRLLSQTGSTGNTMSRKRNIGGKLVSGNPLLLSDHFLSGSGITGFDSGSSGGGGGALFGTAKSMYELTNQDCEVNAPLESKPLLDGPEILSALDT